MKHIRGKALLANAFHAPELGKIDELKQAVNVNRDTNIDGLMPHLDSAEALLARQLGGFGVIDDLASACGARLIVHGHHHQSYDAVLPNGVRVRGLAIAETWVCDAVT